MTSPALSALFAHSDVGRANSKLHHITTQFFQPDTNGRPSSPMPPAMVAGFWQGMRGSHQQNVDFYFGVTRRPDVSHS